MHEYGFVDAVKKNPQPVLAVPNRFIVFLLFNGNGHLIGNRNHYIQIRLIIAHRVMIALNRHDADNFIPGFQGYAQPDF